jgi:hypothetical protein
MKSSAQSQSIKFQDAPGDLWSLYVAASDSGTKHSLVITAITALHAIKGKQTRPSQLELACALIVGDALRSLKDLLPRQAYQAFLAAHQIGSREASLYRLLAENADTIYRERLAGRSLKDIANQLSSVNSKRADDHSAFVQRLVGTLAKPVQQLPTNSGNPVNVRDDDDDQVEAMRARARNGYLP